MNMKCKKILACGMLSFSLLQTVPFNCMAHPLQNEYIQKFGSLTESVNGLKKIINKLNVADGKRPFHDIGGLSNRELLEQYLWDNYERFRPYISNISLEDTMPNISNVPAMSNISAMPTMPNILNAAPAMLNVSTMPTMPNITNVFHSNNLEGTNPKPYSRKACVDEELKNRIMGFNPKNSIACKKLKERFGTIKHSELLSIAEAAASMVIEVDPQSTIQIDRIAKRHFIALLKWFDENWYRIEFYVECINLE